MDVIYILLLLQGIRSEMVLHQPQNTVSVDVNSPAVITCVSNEVLEIEDKISWVYRKWGSSETPVWVKSCTENDDTYKYGCKHERYKATLDIYNTQINDSGVYYCAYHYSPSFWKFGNGTNLNVKDTSTSRSSIHILGHRQPLHPHSSLLLVCVVRAAHNTVPLYWNISGTHHKGQIISEEQPNKTWTVMNFISLPSNTWKYGETVTCEVGLQSPPINVYWKIPEKGEHPGFVASRCHSFLIPVVAFGMFLLLIFSIHLIRTLTFADNKTQCLMGKNTASKDEIVYTELNMSRLNKCKKQPTQ
ncbi:uncharacterized protein [Dendropsophus ebraccatus]|uniref:uncharacterized protein n=1 Tax=Dendropsophus ebraccatus TaxID=150705 RepID=UPI003831ADE2